MIKLIHTYTFKYVRPDTRVYPIVRKAATKIHESYWSVPMQIKHADPTNVLISYVCPHQSLNAAELVNAESEQMSLTDFEDIAGMIRMPCIVIVNSMCNNEQLLEEYEIHYTPLKVSLKHKT